MEHEHLHGHAPLAGADLETGRLNGHDLTAGGSHAAANGRSNPLDAGGADGVSDSSDRLPHHRRLEYVDRSVGNGPIDDVRVLADEEDFERPAKKPLSGGTSRILQQVGEARRRQGLSIRCVAQRLGLTVGDVRAKEEPEADMLLSELYRWQEVLDVPLEELLADPDEDLSPRVLMRARMLRVMKTARALRAQSRTEAEHRLTKLLIGQLIEIMPELKEVSAWPTVGHRRTADEIGRIGERPISDDFMHEAI